MWRNKKVSVILGTYQEKNSIRATIEEFLATGYVDEVIVVNNNAQQGTDEEVKKTPARLIYEKRQGYGYAFQRGIEEATGDYIVLAEPDSTFVGSDIECFLVYTKDFPMVFGTRTNQSSILDGAAMGLLRKLANVFEAKVIEILFATNSITDIGCTYKLMRKDVTERLKPLWRETSALFATELLLLAVSERIKFIEIPVTFRARVGESGITAKWYSLVKWGMRIFLFIIIFWLRWISRRIKLTQKK
ncbi:MAG: glycosyltransferase family 2 protein [Patescibacteria group bacterium]